MRIVMIIFVGLGCQRDPVIPAFPDLHLAPASILKELAPYFHRLSAQMRLIGLTLPHELTVKEAAEYPSKP
jgi:cytoplasmic FMR1 interacting protein